MTCPRGPTVQVALLGSSFYFLPSRRARNFAASGSQGFEERVQMLDDVRFAPCHQAVTPLCSPNAAAGAHIDIVNALFAQDFGSTHVVFVIGIPAINNDVARVQPPC